jgi:hypothetical protein
MNRTEHWPRFALILAGGLLALALPQVLKSP